MKEAGKIASSLALLAGIVMIIRGDMRGLWAAGAGYVFLCYFDLWN